MLLLNFQLRSNSEQDATARSFLEINFEKPEQLPVLSSTFVNRLRHASDIFKVKTAGLQGRVGEISCDSAIAQVGLFCAGFPCKPFSMLHAGSNLLGERDAAQMFEVIKHLKAIQPAVPWPHVRLG